MSCWQEGDPAAPLMIVGMAPGREELEADRPFMGPAGRLLWSMLKRCDIDRADCYILNCIGEWPAGSAGGPTPEQYDEWWDRFDAAVSASSADVALLLGGDAFWRFTGLDGGIVAWGGYPLSAGERHLLKRRERVETVYKTSTKKAKKGDPRITFVNKDVNPPSFGGLILPALHPAGVLRTGLATAPVLNAQVQKAARAMRGELRPSRSAYTTSPIIWAGGDVLAVDIETGGIDNGITRIGIARDNDAFSCQWTPASRGATRSLLSSPQRTYVFHNGGFDIPRLEAAGCGVSGEVFDTMLCAALLQPDLPKGLNACGSLYLDCPRWKHLDESDPAKYNALDAIRTYELHGVMTQLLEKTGQRRLFEQTIMKALPILIKMGQRGILLSEQRREEWVTTLQQETQVKLQQWYEKTGNVNPNSSQQLKAHFRKLGMELPFNADGGESTDQQALAKLRAQYPEAGPMLDLLKEVKSGIKDLQTYAMVPTGIDGRVHPSFVPAYKDEDGTGKGLAGTWRITAKEPNLQNQPTRARRMYIPTPGMCFIGADYSQLEARILAWLAQDWTLLEDCDGDIHNRNAARLGVDKTRAKNAFYGWSYLAGAKTLQNTFAGKGFKVSQKECQSMLDGLDSTYKKAAAFRMVAIQQMQAQRYMQNGFGLRRYFPHQSFPAPSAMSTLIQSTGAMMMWTVLPALEAVGQEMGGRLLLTVHDDVLLEVPKHARESGLAAVETIMTQVFEQVAPGFNVPVTRKWSDDSWGEMHEEVHA